MARRRLAGEPSGELEGEDGWTRSGEELRMAWGKLRMEATQATEWMGMELDGTLAVEVDSAGQGSTDGSTRQKVLEQIEH